MKIDGFQAGKLYEAYASKNNQAANLTPDDSSKAEKTDRVEISPKAAGMSEATALSQKIQGAESPADRQARISQLKSLIESGQYNVPSKAVAQSILIGSSLDVKA
jgi:flagellar biosynthesis anti-sigma factor FlgM